jgi:thymidylate kinase
MKRVPKPNLVLSAQRLYDSLQTIAYHEKSVNAVFCTVVRALKRIILAALKPGYHFMTDCSPDELADRITNDARPDGAFALFSGDDSLVRDRHGNYVESDESKFDKSQRETALEMGRRIWKRLHVPDWIIDLHFDACRLT